jgi:tetratricopeptide (TPR) repeat protein
MPSQHSDAIVAAETRLQAIRESEDLSLAFGSAADRELRRLTRDGGPTPPAECPLGWLYWYRHKLLAPPGGQPTEDGKRAYAALMPCFIGGLEPIPEDLFPDIAIGSAYQATVLLERAMAAHDSDAIMAAAALWRRIQEAVPVTAAEWPPVMVMLCVALQGSFEVTGEVADLDAAVDAGRRGIAAVPAGDPRLGRLLANFAAALWLRSRISGTHQHADETVAVLRQGVAVSSGDNRALPATMSSLSAALRERFAAYQDPADLTEAITVARQAVQAAGASHDRARCLAALGNALRVRYAVTGNDDDLSGAIAAFRSALARTPHRHPDRAAHCADLAAALWMRDEDELEEIIELLREAASRMRQGDPAEPLVLSNLSVALWGRFLLAGARPDLDAAIEIGYQAVAPAHHGSASYARFQSNLCCFLRVRGELSGSQADAAAGVEAGKCAVDSTGTMDNELPRRLANLANAQRDTGDLAAAIGSLRLAATACADRDRPAIQSDLGLALDSAGQTDEAVTTLRAARRDAGDGHPRLAGMRANLAAALSHRFAESGSASVREEAAGLLTAVVRDPIAPPSLRAHAARAVCADADLSDGQQLQRAAGLLATATGLLPDIAPRRLSRQDQQGHLAGFGALATDAAALALEAGAGSSAADALGLLEAGRGILLSQVLATRTGLTSLWLRHPRLAERYTHLRELLDTEQDWMPTTASPDGVFSLGIFSLERAAGDRQRLAAAFSAVVAEIRSLTGFSGFMLPPSVDELASQARYGLVAVLNVSKYRSDALLLTAAGITSIRLPFLTPEAVQARVLSLRQDVEGTLNETLDWLWEVAAKPVLAALGVPATSATALPRMWWIPTGALSLLPLHAAGEVMNRVISSYAPTLRALTHAADAAASGAAARSLIVSMPSTPGAPDLKGAAKEARMLGSILPRARVLTEPARAEVLRRLSGCAIAHFACHGITNASDPSRSGLVLADGALTVADLTPLRLNATRLAYLSACSTAVGDAGSLADEAIHITSAFQLAGFPQVVGTLWPIADAAARTFAVAFHSALRGLDHSAEALHETARSTRAQFPSRPSAWAGYVHVGA